MSGELAATLWRRARVYLREARRLLEEGDYDISLVNAEQAAQLAVKAVYVELLGYTPRGHGLRRLLGYLARVLEEAGLAEQARVLQSFTAQRRDTLVLLEDAYTLGRYGLPGYTERDAEEGFAAAAELLQLLEELRRRIRGGEGGAG